MNEKRQNHSKRDLRIDFFRGCALLIILIDHVEEMNGVHFLQSWTFRSIGFSDMADAFVFLSGYSFGMAFSRRMMRDGFLACLRRASFRSAQIYGGFLVLLVSMLLMGYALQSTAPTLSYALNLQRPIADQLELGLTLSNFAAGPMLRLYIFLLPYGVCQVWLLRRHPHFAWAIALLAYLVSQCFPELNFRNMIPGHCHWYVSVLAWQFLYFVGLAFGSKSLSLPRHRAVQGMAALIASLILLVSLLLMKSIEMTASGVITELASTLDRWPAATEKMTLGPLRLVHFACLAYAVSLLAEKFPLFAKGSLAAPVVLVGQHPLLMYCVGVFMSYASMAICRWFGTDTSSMLILHFDLVLISIVIAAGAQSLFRRSTTDPLSPSADVSGSSVVKTEARRGSE